MSRWALLSLIAFLQQRLHAVAIGLEDLTVVGLGFLRLAEPPDQVDGIFDADAAHRDPFGGARQPCRIVPVKFLSKSEFKREFYRKLEMIDAAHRGARDPRAADVQHEAAAGLEDAVNLPAERQEPRKITLNGLIAVFLLAGEGEGWGGHYEIDAIAGHSPQNLDGVGMENSPRARAISRY